MTKEQCRLDEARTKENTWKKWGPYLSERQWGTVREDYSEDGDAWDYFTHDQARSRGIVGARMVWRPFPTITRFSVLRWHCGTAKTRSLRNALRADEQRRQSR
jgi:hypothetical protein